MVGGTELNTGHSRAEAGRFEMNEGMFTWTYRSPVRLEHSMKKTQQRKGRERKVVRGKTGDQTGDESGLLSSI